MQVTIKELEEQILSLELVVVLFRASKKQTVLKYPFVKQIGDKQYISLLVDRLTNTYPDLEFEIVDGNGNIKHTPITKLSTIRETFYKQYA